MLPRGAKPHRYRINTRRPSPGAAADLSIATVRAARDRAGAHWAFYAFREDAWDAMDYELGKGKVDWRYWEAMEQGKPDPVSRKATPVFEPIRKRLSAGRE